MPDHDNTFVLKAIAANDGGGQSHPDEGGLGCSELTALKEASSSASPSADLINSNSSSSATAGGGATASSSAPLTALRPPRSPDSSASWRPRMRTRPESGFPSSGVA